VQLCINAGVASVEHGYFISERSLAAMAGQGIAWVPTVVPVAAQLQGERRHSDESRRVIERTYQRQLEMVALADSLGVRLGIGTDAGAGGVPHGEGYGQEMELFRQAGLSPLRVLQAATAEGAEIIGAGERLGRIVPGRPPSLLLVRGNPAADLSALRKIDSMVRIKPASIPDLTAMPPHA
jgi:imidazolonepropionase-like amidohydrolase